MRGVKPAHDEVNGVGKKRALRPKLEGALLELSRVDEDEL
jgi:hypothetical protein